MARIQRRGQFLAPIAGPQPINPLQGRTVGHLRALLPATMEADRVNLTQQGYVVWNLLYTDALTTGDDFQRLRNAISLTAERMRFK